MKAVPCVGISACFFHADPKRPLFKGKTLLYFEQSMAHYVMSGGAMPVLIPTASESFDVDALVSRLDGLLLHGGSDIAPKHYGEEPIDPKWSGNPVRDVYEIALFESFLAQRKPVLGICRGIQLMNVARGGTLYQDIQTQKAGAQTHRDWEVYDQLSHDVRFVEGSNLHRLYGVERATVNSVHHQAIKDLADDLVAEAFSEPDGIIEAVRLESETWAVGVQWHPEFQNLDDERLLDRQPLLEQFMDAVRQRMSEEAASGRVTQ